MNLGMQIQSSAPGPLVSVVIPVRNAGTTLAACLKGLSRSYYRPAEIIVVDDHSTDESVSIARQCDCQVVQLAGDSGANSARNLGARNARGEILIFVDSDIVVGRETILAITESLGEDGTDAVVGIYTARHRHESFVSQYKNLWVRYSYMKSTPAIDWLFGSISGIRKSAFESIGGFDVALMARQGHDDIELGKRLARANLSIRLDMDIEVEHLKKYTIGTFIQNEFYRSMGFSELAARFGELLSSLTRGFANVYPVFVLSTLLSITLLLLLVLAGAGRIEWWVFNAVLGFYLLINIRFLNYLEQVRGLFAMVVMVPFLYLDHLICFAGSIAGIVRRMFKSGPRQGPF